MARRSAQNPRYRRDADVGSTRKSAASAKPKRDVGASGGTGGKAPAKKTRLVDVNPDTPEFRRWRKIWIWLLVAGLILSIGAFVLRTQSPQAGTLSLFAAYGALFSAIYIEFTKLRRMRKEWVAQTSGGKKAVKPAEEKKKAEDTSKEDSSADGE